MPPYPYRQDYVVPPEHILRRAVSAGLITIDEAMSPNLRDAAQSVADELMESWPVGEGFGSSDMTYAMESMLRQAGIPVEFTDFRLVRKGAEANPAKDFPHYTWHDAPDTPRCPARCPGLRPHPAHVHDCLRCWDAFVAAGAYESEHLKSGWGGPPKWAVGKRIVVNPVPITGPYDEEKKERTYDWAHRGLVVDVGERDDSMSESYGKYAVVHDTTDPEQFKEVHYWGGYWGTYPTHVAEVDAPPELITKYQEWRLQKQEAARRLRGERSRLEAEKYRLARLKEPSRGKYARVVRGRKVPVGIEGTIIWVGPSQWGDRVGIKDAAGNVYWTYGKNIDVVV